MSDYTNQYYAQRSAASPPKKPSIGVFVLAAIFVVIGVLILVTRKDVGMDLVAEADLKAIQGKPKVIKVELRKARGFNRIESLNYSVGGVKGYISQYHPKYDDVYAAVRRGSSLNIWIDHENNIYKMKDGSRTILAYDDTAKESGKLQHAGLAVGMGLLIAGFVVAGIGCVCYYLHDSHVNSGNLSQRAAC